MNGKYPYPEAGCGYFRSIALYWLNNCYIAVCIIVYGFCYIKILKFYGKFCADRLLGI